MIMVAVLSLSLLSGALVRAAPPAQDSALTPITAATVGDLVELTTIHHHNRDVWSAAFSPDGAPAGTGDLLATGDYDGRIRLWDVSDPANVWLVTEWQAHDFDIYALAFSPDGTMLASAGWDGKVRLWALPRGDGKPDVLRVISHNEPVYTVAFSPDGRYLASGGGYSANRVIVWDVENMTLAFDLGDHYDWVNDVAFSPDGRFLVSASGDGALRRWDMAGEFPPAVYREHKAPVGGLAFSPDGAQIATSSLDGTLKLWDSASGEVQHTIDTGGYVWQITYTPDGSLIVGGADDGQIKFWDAASGDLLLTAQGHTNWVNGIAINPAGTLIASAGDDGMVKLWAVDSGTSSAALPNSTASTRGQGPPPLPLIEQIAQRVHLHNSRSGDITLWAGGILGTETQIAPSWTLGDPLEGWSFPGLGDDQPGFALDDFERPTLVNGWASWCGPCVQEFPLLAAIALAPDAHSYDIVFLNTWDSSVEDALRFLENQPDGLRIGLDADGALLDTVGAVGIPTSILLDENQNVLAIHLGNYTAVQAALFELIAADPGGYVGTFDPAALDVPVQLSPTSLFDPADAIDLDMGDSVRGAITADAFQQAYRFTGQAGDVISVRMEADEVRPRAYTLEPYVVLYGPDGEFLVESADFLYEPYAEIGEFTLPDDGTYFIVATRYMGRYGYSSGEYTLTVELE